MKPRSTSPGLASEPIRRRSLLRSAAAIGGGLLLGVSLPVRGAPKAPSSTEALLAAPNAFIRIQPDERITVIIGRTEIGQGAFTSIPMLVAEELEVSLQAVRFESAPADPAYDHPLFGMQMTGGSLTTMASWEPMRRAGATAREMLITAAARQWKVPRSQCKAELGHVIHSPSGRRLSYGQLCSRAVRVPVPADVQLKPRQEWRVIGRSSPRLDAVATVRGATLFGIDVQLPGMLVAAVARPPAFGSRVKSFDANSIATLPGIRAVVPVMTGVGIVAESFWIASRAAQQLKVEWTESPLAHLSSDDQRSQYDRLSQQPGIVARNGGDVEAAWSQASQRLDAVFEVPYLAHAIMEPLNCVASVHAGGCEVWTGTQYQKLDRESAALEAGVPLERVQLHTLQCGTGFGRRWAMDSHFVIEAVQLSRAVHAPVKVIWTREDDLKGGWYRPRYFHRISGGLAQDGSPLCWHHRVVGQPIMVGSTEEARYAKDGLDTGHVGGEEPAYVIPNSRLEIHMVRQGPPVQPYRGVGGTHNTFVTECFFDELAHAAGRDSLAYRLSHFKENPRLRAVLELAARRAGWGRILQKGRGMGIGIVNYHAKVAQIAEVEVSPGGEVRVQRIVCAVDAGTVVNPSGFRAQVEGGILFALSPVLHCEIVVERGCPRQTNFADYPVLSMAEAPDIEVLIVPSEEPPEGIGEPPVPPVAPAVANAVFAATGRRVRKLPITAESLRGWANDRSV